MKLSERIRPDVECAPWVIGEVKALEQEVESLRQQLAAYEAEPVKVVGVVYEGGYNHKEMERPALHHADEHPNIEVKYFPGFTFPPIFIEYIRKPTSTANLEAVKAQVRNEAMEKALRDAQKTQVAWLVERKGKDGAEWACICERTGLIEFTSDHMKALRFSRRVDADLFAGGFEHDDTFASEHVWHDMTDELEGRG